MRPIFVFFFFQAEDGIRDLTVTGVQTCALPICQSTPAMTIWFLPLRCASSFALDADRPQIGRASCREGVDLGGRRIIKKKRYIKDSKTLVIGTYANE